MAVESDILSRNMSSHGWMHCVAGLHITGLGLSHRSSGGSNNTAMERQTAAAGGSVGGGSSAHVQVCLVQLRQLALKRLRFGRMCRPNLRLRQRRQKGQLVERHCSCIQLAQPWEPPMCSQHHACDLREQLILAGTRAVRPERYKAAHRVQRIQTPLHAVKLSVPPLHPTCTRMQSAGSRMGRMLWTGGAPCC